LNEQTLQVEVLIVGLGPAGAACGMALARSGVNVLALDRAHFPRDKICGDALPLNAQRLIQHLEVTAQTKPNQRRSRLQEFGSARARLHHLGETSRGWQRDGDTVVSAQACLQTVRRLDLDQWLVERCRERQLPMQFGWQVETLRWIESSQCWEVSGRIRCREGVTTDRFAITTPLVVACDGASSTIRKQCRTHAAGALKAIASRCYWPSRQSGLPTVDDAPLSRLHYRWPGEATYAWAFAVPGGFNCGVATMVHRDGTLPHQGRELIARTREWIKALQPDLGPCDQPMPAIQTMAIPVLHPTPEPSAPAGILFTGDAASLVDPHQGHGIDRALESGALAAMVILQGKEDDVAAAVVCRRYEQRLAIRLQRWRRHWQDLDREELNDAELEQALRLNL